MRRLLTLLYIAVSPAVVSAEVNWPQRMVELRPKPNEPQVVATFPFTNSGKNPVTITSLKTSCDCTTASLARYTYAPGEGGSITATFTIGGRTGTQTKTILVQTTDETEGTVLLTMQVHLPEVLTLTPRYVSWPVGGEREAKSVILRVEHPNTPVKVLLVRSSSPVLVAELKTVEEGNKYLVTLTPNETDRALSARITVETDWPKDKPRSFTFLARVLPGGGGPTTRPTTRPVQQPPAQEKPLAK